jgi:23S rRNA pseudouridine1911/1915/1917 synthase
MLRVLYEDKDIIVCVKPVGVLSQGQADKDDNMIYLLGQHFSRNGENATAFCVHRLDRSVGGTMVFAKTQRAAAKLSALVSSNGITKEYLAVVCGKPEQESGIYKDLLFKDSSKNKSFVVKRMRKGVKEASLEYNVVGSMGNDDRVLTLVRIRLHTGRSHQIRVQFASRKYPLVGDHKYGSRDGASAPMLFSCRITFPWKGETKRFEAYPSWAQQV